MAELSDPINVPAPQPIADHAALAARMRRAEMEAAQGVPLSERTSLSPSLDEGPAVVTCNDGRPMYRLPGFGDDPKATTKCEMVEHDSQLPSEVVGKKGASVIGRSDTPEQAIPVQRIDLELGTIDNEVPVMSKLGTDSAAPPANAPIAARPRAADGAVGVAQPDITVTPGPSAEHGVGVQPVERTVTQLGTGRVPAPQEKRASGEFDPSILARASRPPVQMEGPVRQEQTVSTPAPGRARGPKKRVKLSSQSMGTHRIKVDYVGVSEVCVVLGYVDDDDANIVEPPLCKRDDPIIVEIDGQGSCPCAYYGMSSYMEVEGAVLFLVVLTRVDE